MDKESDEEGVYLDSGTNGAQPTVEGTGPDGRGVGSNSSAGANKRDPMSSGPTTGNTIAGRTVDTDSNVSDTNANSSGDDRE